MITYQDQDGLRVITINRPDKANSLTKAMLEQLCDVTRDPGDAQAVIITGKGRVFSAGADLEEARAGLATDDVWERLSGNIAALPCLTIAALNGTLAGGAFGMALACDIRLSVPEAKFFYPVMKLGFLPQPSDPKRMSALIGPARTKFILMGGQKITSDQAYQFGLIDQIITGDALIAHANELCADAIAADSNIHHKIKSLCS
ncbi:enoyl-CoA hydratase/isomerase family protein [Parasulfitobacter algicola]|uniref:Enoyl-CoA hydratase/isomerase family protein n=1 Tax=Parasulfitobacter algicola TaxID=2614809 RepID=A0ABX2ILN4_9RHOB|nr:enoyl-CoA hydratase/isomerase family protein [Sulfitobacter algicola]NSX53791.1 enoyl-CoA hydratase/isomerase family protein [Sulfitobacter algicola]